MMRLTDLFGGGTPDNPAARQRQEDSQRSLEAGGLPLNAVDRLREQASRQGTDRHFFTSDLSVNELMLVRQAGYQPLGQVMGSTVYHVGWQWQTLNWSNTSRMGGGVSGELAVLTTAFYHARHLALGRLQQEAALLGASGVVGVRLERKEYEWGVGLLEFAAIGTAIREVDRPAPAGPPLTPFLSALSGQEFWKLRQAGFRPVALVVGNCTYYQIPSWTTRNVTQGGFFGLGYANQELPDYTQSVYNARALAMGRMEDEARAAHGTGVVGADVEIEAEPHEVDTGNHSTRLDMLYHFTAIGTAIAPARGLQPAVAVLPVQSLKDTSVGLGY